MAKGSILTRVAARLVRRRVDWVTVGNEAVATRDARASASRFSRGNVAIQSGYFLTSADLEREREEVSRIKLPK